MVKKPKHSEAQLSEANMLLTKAHERMLWLLTNPIVFIDFMNRECLVSLTREIDDYLAPKKKKVRK